MRKKALLVESFCFRCGRNMDGASDMAASERFCAECMTVKPVYDLVRAPFVYEDGVKRLVYKTCL